MIVKGIYPNDFLLENLTHKEFLRYPSSPHITVNFIASIDGFIWAIKTLLSETRKVPNKHQAISHTGT